MPKFIDTLLSDVARGSLNHCCHPNSMHPDSINSVTYMQNNTPQSTQSKLFTIPFINVTVERRVDIVAILAFLLALFAAVNQLIAFLQGANVVLIPPEQILLRFVPTDDQNDDREFLTINARMAYVNLGSQGYNAVIQKEAVSFSVGPQRYIQYWHAEQNITDLNHDGELEVSHVGEAQPRPIIAGNALSREITFVPYPEYCPGTTCDVDKNFIFKGSELDEILNQREVTFMFSYKLYGEAEFVSVKCAVLIDNRIKNDLTAERGWTAPPCRSE